MMNTQTTRRVRSFSLLNTSCARSPCHHSFKMKRVIRTPQATSVPIMLAECHGFVTPPHSMARMKHIVAAIMMKVPMKSICRNFSLRLAFTGLAATGVLKRIRMIKAEGIPIGRLM